MRNFYRIASGIDIRPIALALHKSSLWNQYTLRTATPGSPHREVDDIWLRMNDLNKCRQAAIDPGIYVDHRESINYPGMTELPVKPVIMALMNQVSGDRLGRCLISRMKPGTRILPHKDIGDDLTIYYDNELYYSRYHIVIQGLPGSVFRSGDEEVNMQTGEIWWFRNDIEHEVMNYSADDRIHIVCDIHS